MEGDPFGRYRLVSILGRGGMGEVWRAFDTATNRVVALKVLPAQLADDEAFKERFRREARAAAGIYEPHVVPIHHYGEIEGRLYVDMPLIEGADLESLLSEGPVVPARAVAIVAQVAAALNAAHRIGLVHRDVKPSNVLIAESDFAYLIDFGIARAAGQTGMTATGSVVGTWAYMAPERFGSADADPRSDVYALACVLYQCLTGSRPFPGETIEQQVAGHLHMPSPRPSATNPDVPASFDAVIAEGMAKNPADRYQTTTELAQAASAALTNPNPPSGPTVPAPHPPDRVGAPQSSSAPTRFTSEASAAQTRVRPSAWTGPVSRPPVAALGRRVSNPVLLGAAVGLLVIGSIVALILFNMGGDDQTSNAQTSSPRTNSNPATAAPDCGGRQNLTGEGSTAQANAITEFNQAWGQVCPAKTLAYNPTGSGAGVTQFIANQVDFAGSDAPLSADQASQTLARCGGNPAWNLPLVFGPIAMAYNVEGVDKLTLNADVLAKIFSGAITTWNDPAIAALNPGVAMPGTKTVPIYRSDSSGTTDNFQKYLTAAAPEAWSRGAGKEFQGGAGEGAPKSSGVVQAVQTTPGSIGYVEQAVAKAANLPFAQIDNGGGAVALTDETAAKAIGDTKFASAGMDLVLDKNSLFGSKAPGAYPLVLVTYEIVCSKGYDADTGAAVRSFLTVAANQGQANLSAAGFVPLPDGFRERLLASVSAIA